MKEVPELQTSDSSSYRKLTHYAGVKSRTEIHEDASKVRLLVMAA
jgi:hypothetical protein